MATLYELSKEYTEALNNFSVDEETGEVTFDENKIDHIESDLKDKADNIACFIKNLTALSDSIKAEKNALDERLKANDKKIESLKKYITSAMELAQMDRLETARNKITFRTSKKVIISDDDAVPEKYIKLEITSKVDKKAIGEALKAGEVVNGCYLEVNNNIQIK